MSIEGQIEGCQAVGTYLLETLADVCYTHGINFFLDAGTLIGAYRQGGWLAWDDDVDVLMMRPEYERFRAVAGESLPRDTFLIDPELDRECASVVPRLNYTRSGFDWEERLGMRPPERQRVVVDIYIMDVAPERSSVRLVWLSGLKVLQVMQAVRSTTFLGIRGSEEPGMEKFVGIFAWAASHGLPIVIWKKLYARWAGAFSGSPSSLVSVTSHSRANRAKVYPRAWFPAKPSRLPFEGREYPVPEAEGYLAKLYGPNFKTPPPESERRPHQLAGFWAVLGKRSWGPVPEGTDRPENGGGQSG